MARTVVGQVRTQVAIGIALGFMCASTSASERWAEYAVASMMPAYEWVDVKPVIPTVLDARKAHTETFVSSLRLAIAERTTVSFGIDRDVGGSMLDSHRGRFDRLVDPSLWNGIERRRFTASLEQSFSDQSVVRGGVVLVHQSFATAGHAVGRLGFGRIEQPLGGVERLAYGSGVRLGFVRPLTPSVWIDAEYRSRVDMDALLGYRGLYGEPGDFDLPAAGTAVLGVQVSPTSELMFGVSRVMYADVAPFTSNLLPTRLLSLLGDGTSPKFRWRDLTVYSLDWSWQPSPGQRWSFHYSSSQQPRASSALLTRALGDERKGFTVGGVYDVARDDGSLWRVGVSWSPVSYLNGHSLRQRRDLSGPLLEVEAVWLVPF